MSKELTSLVRLLESSKGKCLVLTGAGLSTDSGIPDYRGPQGIYTRHPSYKPIRYQEFVERHERRQKYWVRSLLGWPRIENAQRNASHLRLHELEQRGYLSGLVTQNVDGLHLSNDLLELHGTLHKVHCLSCHQEESRKHFQERLRQMNPSVAAWMDASGGTVQGDVASSVNPDGDMEVHFSYDSFVVPDCLACGGVMKPSVIFFGENIPVKQRNRSFDMVDDAEALLVLATSLQVYSAYRLVKRARDAGKPVAIVTVGETRGDALANLRLNANVKDVLEHLSLMLN